MCTESSVLFESSGTVRMLLKKALGSDRLYCSMVGVSMMKPLPHAIPGYLFAWPVPDNRKNAPGLMVSTACGEMRTCLRSQRESQVHIQHRRRLYISFSYSKLFQFLPLNVHKLTKGCPE